jgi:hypothetical protein
MIVVGAIMFVSLPLRVITNPPLLPSVQPQHLSAIVVCSFGVVSLSPKSLAAPNHNPVANLLMDLLKTLVLSLLLGSMLVCALALLYGGVRFEFPHQ